MVRATDDDHLERCDTSRCPHARARSFRHLSFVCPTWRVYPFVDSQLSSILGLLHLLGHFSASRNMLTTQSTEAYPWLVY